ncbi:MAG: cytochrome c biogenesis protein CcsA [Pseudolabrys sp.]
MIPELGHYALVLALGLGLIQSIAPVIGARVRDAALMRLASTTALMQFAFVATSFAALTYCYVTSDFSVVSVFENSHSMMPLIYKVTSVWGNHEGSMLLWGPHSVAVRRVGFAIRQQSAGNAEGVSAGGAILDRLRLLSLHFAHLESVPAYGAAPLEGRDLNPILQDIGLAIHPPLLYLGYVGFSIAFSFAIAALIEGRIDAAWARWCGHGRSPRGWL